MFTVPVRGESAQLETNLATGDDVQHARCEYTSHYLGDHVSYQVGNGESLPGGQSYRDCWIEMPPGDPADGVHHGKYSQTERQRHTRESDPQCGESGR